ncbi:MAG: NACHT domain-containing protein, partial [Armatimonadetes bacterium]|nr:NACHT domain-containing protein [Armatimonadota bacterium]
MHIDKLQLDPVTALVTALFMSVAYYLGKIVVRYVRFLGGYAVEGMMYWASRFLMPSMAAVLTMKRYCRLQLAGQSGTLHVPSRMDVNLDIDTVYITLALEHQGSGEPSYTHENLLALGNTLLVVGDPGSGKSSLVKRLFRDACHQALARPSKSRLPVLMELKHLSVPEGVSSTDLGDWFLTELRGQVESCATYNMGACFDSYAQGRGLLVLLDGLDEVVTARYAVVQAAIQQLARRLAEKSENNVALVTMRTQFHQQVRDAYRDTFSHVLYLKPFSPTDIYEFLTRWPFRTGADENIARIYKELTDRPTLRDMCSNPLILAMYVAEDQAGGHVATPETRTEFYSRVTEELLIRRRQAQTRNLEAPAAMREQRQRILGRLAFEHLVDPEQPSNSLDWGHAKLVVREVTGCAESESEAIFRELAKETGMVAEERPGQTFRFIHLTFCEFMAAYEAVQGQTEGWSSLLHAHTRFLEENEPQFRSRLVEAIPFACGLLPRVRRSMALTQVCALQDRGLTARCFLETKLYDHDSWGEFVGAESSRLLSTPERQWDETWLRDLHLFNVVVRDANAYSAHVAVRGGTIGLDEFYRSLVASQRDSLAKLLGSYASQDAAAAFRLAEVCGLDLAADFPAVVVANCDQS